MRRSFTLIELMVAMALMTILTGSVVFIFVQSQEIFTTVDARVQVYQYSRFAFDQMERDLSNVVRTHNMEFFNDLPPPNGRPGRYDPGEEAQVSGKDAPDSLYHKAFSVRQNKPYPAWGSDVVFYRRDSLYFKTVTVVNGETTAALLEYAVADTDRERPRLVKKMWRVTGVDGGNPLRPLFKINDPHPTGGVAGQPVITDLCLYAVECKLELFVRNRRWHDPGNFYEVQELENPPRRPGVGGGVMFEPHKNLYPPPNIEGNRLLMCIYDEEHEPRASQPDLGEFLESEQGLFRTEQRFTFPMLREGDVMSLSGGGLPAKDYTVKAFVKPNGDPFEPGDPPSAFRIAFDQPVEWPQGMAGQDLKVRYLTSWLPPALRMSIKIKDAKSLEVRSVQRVFKILSSN